MARVRHMYSRLDMEVNMNQSGTSDQHETAEWHAVACTSGLHSKNALGIPFTLSCHKTETCFLVHITLKICPYNVLNSSTFFLTVVK